MGRRITLEVVSILVITVVLALVGLMLVTGGDAASSGDLLGGAARFLFGATGIALALWIVLLIVGAVVLRHRPVGVRIGVHLLTAVVAIAVNTVLLSVVGGAAEGGWSDLVMAIALGAGAVLLAAAVVGVLVTELVIVRPRRVPRPD